MFCTSKEDKQYNFCLFSLVPHQGNFDYNIYAK